MGTSLHGAAGVAVDPVAWTRRRNKGGQGLIEKCAGPGADATHARRRLRNHYIVAFGLECPGVARPLALTRTESGLVLSLPWISGVDLFAYRATRCADLRSDSLPADEILDVAHRLARLLAGVGDRGIVHGDLSPDHVVVGAADGALWLLNFGASQFVRGASGGETAAIVDPNADLRALGRLVCWLASGRQVESPQADAQSAADAQDAMMDLPESIREIAARLLNAGGKNGYWCAAAAAEDILARRRFGDSRALGSRGAPSDLILSTRRVGRSPNVDALLDAYAEATKASPGPSGRVAQRRSVLALVEGGAGIGKTTLVSDACRAMRQSGARVDFGKFNQYGDSRPMSALIQALDNVVGQILDDEKGAHAACILRIQTALGALAQVVVDVVPRLMFLLGPQPAPPPLSPEASRARFELLLRRFVGALATKKRPLVLVLDDLQWADQRSLDLMRDLLRDSSIRHLLVVGAYRSEAITPGHPLTAIIENIAAIGGQPHRIHIAPWRLADVVQFLDDINIAADQQRAKLADILHDITSGNPLGVLMALRGAQDLDCLRFDSDAGCWRADMRTAGATLARSSILSLVGARISRLPPDCCDMLAICTLFGASFDLEKVAVGAGQTNDQVMTLLWPALAAGLLVVDDNARPSAIAVLRARHDIVQQAAYLTIGEERSRQLHGEIGRAMLEAYTAADTLQENAFEVVDQFSKGTTKGLSEEERSALIDLNVSAGRQARSSGAMDAAFRHYREALKLVDENEWTRRPEAMFEMNLNAAEVAYLAAKFSQFDRLVEGLEALAVDTMDAARVQELKFRGLLARNRMREALEVGQRTLVMLGAPLAQLGDPRQWPQPPGLDELRVGRPSTAREDAVLRALGWLAASAFFVAFDLFVRVVLTMFELAVSRPFAADAPLSFVSYGLILCASGRAKDGFAAGQIAMALSERLTGADICRVRMVYYGLVDHWSRPARESLQPLLDNIREALLCGELEMFDYCAALYWTKAWALEPLGGFEPVLIGQVSFAEHFGRRYPNAQGRMWLQFIHALTGRSHRQLTLTGDAFDAQGELAQLEGTNTAASLFVARFLMAVLDWHRGDVAAALEQCRMAQPHALAAAAVLISVDHVMLWCLCELECCAALPEPERARKLRWVDSSIVRLRGWADAAPDNSAHKLALVEAERAKAVGDFELARDCFERALEIAASTHFLHDRALIRERAGAFFRGIGLGEEAQELLAQARGDYRAWGATAIAEAVEARYAG
jgi:AAA ATPase domain